MKHYHKNPRQITKRQMTDLQKWLVEFGDLSGIVHNIPTDEIIGGNQRSEALPGVISGLIQPVITERYDPPLEDGTVCNGYYEIDGRKYAYRGVNWDDKKAERANLIANKAGGTFDMDILANQFDLPVLLDSGFEERELIGFDFEGIKDEKYTSKVNAPVYEIKGEKPELADLYTDEKTSELLAEIDTADIPESDKSFLRIAATRHTVFNFQNIAEYYAHSPAPVQRLMENSALVIIDFDRAIELGYVKLTEEIKKQFAREYPDA